MELTRDHFSIKVSLFYAGGKHPHITGGLAMVCHDVS